MKSTLPQNLNLANNDWITKQEAYLRNEEGKRIIEFYTPILRQNM